MARVYTKKTSRVEHICGRTGHVIPKGEGYYAAAPGFRGREIFRCLKHPFRPSELVTGLRSQPLAALEALEDAIPSLEEGDYDGLTGLLEEFASEVRSYAEEREQALDAWENGNSQLEDLNDIAQSAADEAEAIENDVAEFDEEEPTADEYDDADEFEAAHEEWERAKGDHWDETVSNALDAAQSIEF
jgi:hypothetical protein